MPRKTRTKPIAVFEHGTRIYAPTTGEPRYRVVGKDPLAGRRFFNKFKSEEPARERAREVEQLIADAVEIEEAKRAKDREPRTVRNLAARYQSDYLTGKSKRFQGKQEGILRLHVLPTIGDHLLKDWTSAESEGVLTKARNAGLSDAYVQDIGAAMRALVTYARRLRWLTAQSDDPMWLVSYSKKAEVQGEHVAFIPRSTLPTDDHCEALFSAMEKLKYKRWALAMRLKHRSGLRWGELIALQPIDLEFEPSRVVHVRRAVELPTKGRPSIKRPKNNHTRTSIFPKSLVDSLQELVDEVQATAGPTGLLFPSRTGGIIRRSNFQQIWIRAADKAGWPMTSPRKKTDGYGKKNKGWRWTGAAKWTLHDLRHVAACWMLFDLGLEPPVVAEFLGHSDPSFTVRRYVGIRGNPEEAATLATDAW